jgi:hypothetical protein
MISTWIFHGPYVGSNVNFEFKKNLSQIFDIVTFGLVKTNKVINVEIILESPSLWFGERDEGEMNILLF